MSEEKILKSEELNEEELDEVAGGSLEQIRSDFKFFEKIGVKDLDRDCAKWISSMYTEVRYQWRKLGIDYDQIDDSYVLKSSGEKLTPDQARIHAIKVLKGKK
ncbi:MAG: hypothetical protein IJT06_07290 [Selenomonadaceae bacterium]|nr:hypothetical protein [Selenomonadaceae bacterium]